MQRLKISSKQHICNLTNFVRSASNNFGPALNKHLPLVLTMVKKKQDLASVERIHDLKEALVNNGGEEAESIVMRADLK